ncbi:MULTISPECIES: hypothetical protein [Enterobacter cloacae complex]|uniref:Uncharacterized protein n=3 Tax=Enterobacter cloacae complex TaxID=354276 RepID=A0ABU6KRV3_ENTAS|nr:hypothetical protein [Enterobacter asburiae]MBS7115628.1 hypothetical protein [Enterobacter cloacae]MCK1016681.1 hypothetical protein [Enterobacter asburiae]MCM7648160.1 hypothetical protein [Enterobacter asburiae]MDL4614735.1 hypothetical protein [Enterobacter asburiae]MDU2341608.1 hypothetical protein [Enterobacter asburiae]
MLPANIYNMVNKLIEMTRSGQVSWSFDYYNDKVSASLPHFSVSILSRFDSDTGISYLHVDYFDNNNRQSYRFSTDMYETQYDTVRVLYDEAQASNLDIKF